MTIPGRHIAIANRPINSITVTLRCCKIKFTPSCTSPAPDERFAAYLVAAYPLKRFFLYVGMILILYKKMLSAFIISCGLADERIFFYLFFCDLATMAKLPNRSVHGRIVFDVLNISPTF